MVKLDQGQQEELLESERRVADSSPNWMHAMKWHTGRIGFTRLLSSSGITRTGEVKRVNDLPRVQAF